MKRIYFILVCFILWVSACQKFDDIALWNMANNQEERLTALEELCSQMNTNIQALRDLIGASNDGDYVLNVSPILKEEIEIGYTITFAKSGTITIYHGRDGKDGADGKDGENGTGTTPAIGLKQDTDGIYYWTLNNEWLLDDSGKKIKASGRDGQDGKTPKLKIENGRWLLSMDNGNTWEDIGKATGDNGQDGTGGDSMFKKIDYTTNNEYVIFTLADNTELKLPKYGQGGASTGELSITFSETTDILVEPLVDYEITYSLTGADVNTTVEAIGIDGFIAIVKPTSATTGIITIKPPFKNDNKTVLVFVTNGIEKTVIKTLTFKYDDAHMYVDIPDAAFKQYLLKIYDSDRNFEISYAEALKIGSISCAEKDIRSLEGIQYFINLRTLDCTHNSIQTLDLSNNIALIELNCNSNLLTSLNVSMCTKLEKLMCNFNYSLNNLNIKGCTKLKTLYCQDAQLSSLDVSTNINLRTVHIRKCKFSAPSLNQIYMDLPEVAPWQEEGSPTWYYARLDVGENPGSETSNKNIAEKKGWKVQAL